MKAPSRVPGSGPEAKVRNIDVSRKWLGVWRVRGRYEGDRAGGAGRCQTVQCLIDHIKDVILSLLRSEKPLKSFKKG